MNNSIATQIIEAEEQLRLAILSSDVEALDRLLSPELIFTNHLGQVLSKEDDLMAHRSGIVKVQVLTPSEQHIQIKGAMAIVSVRMHLFGSYDGVTSDSDFRFTRIWTLSANNIWQVIAAHSSIII
ncbi:MAG: nuclear transport factor 2 family protein [Xenococcaceae cyanobacterium]